MSQNFTYRLFVTFEKLAHFILLGLSAMLAESVTYPIDTAKTRLQLQGQNLVERWSLIKYRGMSNCLVTIVKEEGVKAVYQEIDH